MGYERHNAIIISASYEEEGHHWIDTAYRKAILIFENVAQVTDPIPPAMNGYRSFMIAPDGSKEGWGLSDDGDNARNAFVTWLKAQAYEDGSSPLQWVEVQYGDDNLETKVIRDSDEDRRNESYD